MDITRFNQTVAFADFAAEVARCDFCAVDQEMTGVDVPGTTVPLGAPPEAVYHAKRVAVEAYNAFQMGIALFTKTGANTYEVRPYNFYLLNGAGDLRLSLSAISFLAANHMNFQTWLTSGLSFCNADEEAAYEKKHAAPFDADEQQTVDELLKAVDDWIATDGEPLTVETSCTVDLARRVHGFVGRRYDYRITVTFDGRPFLAQKMKFKFTKLDQNACVGEKEKRLMQRERDRARQLGFRQFWKVLVQSNKPIIGHNFMQDVMFMMHMHETPLPTDYDVFKQQLQCTLPVIYDTKTMATMWAGVDAFQATHLGFVYEECRRRAALGSDEFTQRYRLPRGFYNYNDYAVRLQNKAHEAAYDAYMTGVAFSLMLQLYPDACQNVKNVISAYGSLYYFCVDTEDKLISPSTYVLESAVPCYCEQIEALFFATETPPPTSTPENGKMDLRKLSYHINGLTPVASSKKYTAFCVRMKQGAGLDEVLARLQSLREKELSSETSVDLTLLDHITLRTI